MNQDDKRKEELDKWMTMLDSEVNYIPYVVVFVLAAVAGYMLASIL